MAIFFSHTSALEFWRKTPLTRLLPQETRVSRPSRLTREEKKKAFECAHEIYLAEKPYEIIVSCAQDRIYHSGFKSFRTQASFQGIAFCRAKEGIFVSSPELCFLQMAAIFSLPQLILMGCELSGTYRLNQESPTGFLKANPVLSAEQLTSFLERNSSLAHAKKALQAAPFIIENAASPMESATAILLSLPRRYGGFGLPKPKLNYLVIDDQKQKKYYCDMFWEGASNVDLEYDSSMFHATREERKHDAERRSELARLNVTVVNCTYDNVKTPLQLRKIAQAISKLIKVRTRVQTKDYYQKQYELFQQILPKQDEGFDSCFTGTSVDVS